VRQVTGMSLESFAHIPQNYDSVRRNANDHISARHIVAAFEAHG
jgi:hypothetical protein